MLEYLSRFPIWIYQLAWSAVVILCCSLLGRLVNRTVCQRLSLWAAKTHWQWDVLVIQALRHVERVTCEVAKDTMRTVPGGVPDFEPFVRYHTFDDYSINFTVILRAKEFVDQYLIKHEFIKRIHRRYQSEGILIPFPTRTVHTFTHEAKDSE